MPEIAKRPLNLSQALGIRILIQIRKGGFSTEVIRINRLARGATWLVGEWIQAGTLTRTDKVKAG